MLFGRITQIEEPQVAYLNAGSFDKETRKWAKISKRPVPSATTKSGWQRNTMFVDDLDKWEQIQTNTDDLLNTVTFDVDQPSLFMYPDGIAPYTVTRNKLDDKYHASYLLKTPFYAKSDRQKRVFENEIKPQVKRLALSFGADGRYTNVTTKNPFNTRLFNVTTTGQTIPDVWYLLNQYSGELKRFDSFEIEVAKDSRYLSSQYREAVGALIEHSKMNIRLLTKAKDEKQFIDNIITYAGMLEVDGISQSSMNAIVNDVINKAVYLAEAFVDTQRYKIGKRWGNQVERNKLKIVEAVNTLESLGVNPTMKQISLLVNLSVGSLKSPLYSEVIREAKQ